MDFDFLIQNGRVLDGTGAPELRADVGVRDGRVVALEPGLPRARARKSVDATGRVVAPGFVDIHSHGDLVLAWPSDKRLALVEGRLAQGITTEVVGNCGLGASPLFGPASELLPDINGWMSPDRFAWSWTDLESYFEHLEALGLPVNIASLVAHGPLRLGARGLSSGPSSQADIDEMIRRLDRALDQGALGLSAGLIYPPGMYTESEELRILAQRLKRTDGLFTCHVRGSSEMLLDAVAELIEISEQTGVAAHHSHTEAVGRGHWPKLSQVLELEDAARGRGARVSADMFPYTVAATMMLAIYPPWSLEGGLPRLIGRLQEPQTRERIRTDIDNLVPRWPPWKDEGWPHNLVKAVGWDRILVSTVGSEENRECEGLSLAELGERRRRSPFDAVSDLMIEEDGNVGQFVLDITGDDGLRALITRPDIAFITDANDYGKGKPHPAAYGSFPKVLGQFVRQESLLSLPEAIRRMTSLPADIVGLSDRGRLEEGKPADVVVLDPEVIADRTSLAETRQKAAGIDRVFVAGEVVYEAGRSTGALPGRILRR